MHSPAWNAFRISTQQQVALRFLLQHDVLPCLPVNGEIWHQVVTETETVISYAPHNGRTLFRIGLPKVGNCVRVTAEVDLEHTLQLGIQFALLLYMAHECIGLHGVTVLCNGQRIILSAPSKTGKTTLSKLLQQYCGAEVINGDFAMLSFDKNGRLMFQPTPFCGTSGICQNVSVPIDRIVFLQQSPESIWETMNARQAFISLLSNSFVPIWDSQRGEQIKESLLRLLACVPMNKFSFYPDRNAAELFAANLLP